MGHVYGVCVRSTCVGYVYGVCVVCVCARACSVRILCDSVAFPPPDDFQVAADRRFAPTGFAGLTPGVLVGLAGGAGRERL